MEKICIELENCYGIKELKHEFDIRNGNAFILYAPNGTMKSSFARVFDDFSKGFEPKDLVYPERESRYVIVDENNQKIESDKIFVIKPFEPNFYSDKISTLLLNQSLKKTYEELIKNINSDADFLIGKLSKFSGTNKNTLTLLAESLGEDPLDKFKTLEKFQATIQENNNPGYGSFIYEEIFNDKVIEFLRKEDTQMYLKEYIEKYNDLIRQSTYFKKGIFNHTNATTINKSLKDNGFFEANHKVVLVASNNNLTQVESQKKFEEIINQEKAQILQDPDLIVIFDRIDKAITRNAELKSFRAFLEKFPYILVELLDFENFQLKLWLSYGFEIKDELSTFINELNNNKQEITNIITAAQNEITEWKRVVQIFHERFSVPFTLQITNQKDVILNGEVPNIAFIYNDGEKSQELSRDQLFSVLSTGEQRALYLLNIIFEIESRAKKRPQTILILDDIADSFDYKNKYAIVQYLYSMLKSDLFVMIILTHNFDFFRTVKSRLCISRKNNCLMTIKTNEKIKIVDAAYLNPFTYWKSQVTNDYCLLALIPMVRNLAEYSKGTDSSEYIKLTSLLHRKSDSESIDINELSNIFSQIIGVELPSSTKKVIDLLFEKANEIVPVEDAINLEKKVVLSIAIRIKAEDLIIAKSTNQNISRDISKDQTRELIERYSQEDDADQKILSLLERVNLMTPETIHLNSFMYEPLLDLSDEHLTTLFHDLNSQFS